MINQNNSKSNEQFSGTQKSYSNTPLFLHLPLNLSTNRFKSLLPLLVHSHFYSLAFVILLDYLRVSFSGLTKKEFNRLQNHFFSGLVTKTINKPWHPDPKMPKSKKYQTRILSKAGIVFGVTKRSKYKGRNTRYVYDVMIDLTGRYFANLKLLEQIELICYLNRFKNCTCHRLDVAIDDYSGKLFPLPMILAAIQQGDYFGFKKPKESHIYYTKEGNLSNIPLGSRRSKHFVRNYKKDHNVTRWEAELKQSKANDLFKKITSFNTEKLEDSQQMRLLLKALKDAAFDNKDFRYKSQAKSSKNATRERIKRLPFFDRTIKIIDRTIEHKAIRTFKTIP